MNKKETKPKETLESKTCSTEPEEDPDGHPKYCDKDWRDFYFVTL